MAERKKRKPSWSTISILVTLAVFAVGTTLFGQLGIAGVPSWQELWNQFNPTQQTADSSPVTVDFFDVGQGDCSLITANGAYILIDAGENDQAHRVIDYLEKKGIKRLDIVIGTHPHSDHIGGLDRVIDTFEIGQVILPKLTDQQTPTSKTYLDLLTAIAKKNLKVTPAKAGTVIELGGGQLELRGPIGEYTDLNNVSVVARYVYQQTSFWIAGDCSKAAEKKLLAEKQVEQTTVYKVSHHGSDTATTKKFLDALSPKYCVISVGADNSYGHPHKEISDRLKKAGMPVFRTDLNGTVTISTDGKTVALKTER